MWEALLLTFKVQPSEAHLYSVFYARMCKVPGLSTTIAHFDRQQFGHEDKSYDFLYAAATRLVQQIREERQANELAKILTQPGTQQRVALAVVADKKTLPCFKIRDGAKCEVCNSCPYSHDRQVIETAKKVKQGKGKGGGKGKGNTNGKGKDKLIYSFFKNEGCQRGSACTFLHDTLAMAAKAPEPAAPAAAQAAKKS